MRIRSLIAMTATAVALCVAAPANAAMSDAAASGNAVNGARTTAPQTASNSLFSNYDFYSTPAGQGTTSDLLNLDNMLFSDGFQTFRPFTSVYQTEFGPVTATGYMVRTTIPRLLLDNFSVVDSERYELRDFRFSAPLLPGVMLVAGYNVDMAGHFDGYDLRANSAYDGLFLSASALNAPYLGLADRGNYIGATMQLADDLRFHFSASSLVPQGPGYDVPVFPLLVQIQGAQPYDTLRRAETTEAGLNWNFADWGGLGVTASHTVEHNSLLGRINTPTLGLGESAKTNAVGVSARFGLGDGWVTTFSYNQGITQLNLKPESLTATTDTLHSSAYGVAVAKHGLFSNTDALGIALSRPAQITSGWPGLAGVLDNPKRNPALGRMPLAGGTPETDVELGYVTTFFDGALALQANAGYQMNLQGQAGANSVTVLSRAKINF